MPNGNPKFHKEELPKLESFFQKIAKILIEFGEIHNLKLEKYWHQIPSWRFNFQHPKGGIASIDIEKISDYSVKVYSYWWIDNFDKFTRYSKKSESELIQATDINLNLLENHLKIILAWNLNEWTDIISDYEDSWKPFGRDWIEKDVEKYPKLKI